MISCVNFYVALSDISFNMTFFLMFLGSIFVFVRKSLPLYALFCALALSIGYTSMLLWEQLMPVWWFMPKLLMMPLLVCILVVLMQRTTEGRMVVSVLGMVNGEMLHKLILYGYHIQIDIGSFEFLDQVTVTVLLILVIHTFRWLKSPFYSFPKQLVR
ncbi:hypothetical protein JNUCC1_03649 [Lentibacillus sp. JNUCC-1]|nr:hypothetical protein [Lentibacillus sp. JNUCC-1]